jgi:hypothetical protein
MTDDALCVTPPPCPVQVGWVPAGAAGGQWCGGQCGRYCPGGAVPVSGTCPGSAAGVPPVCPPGGLPHGHGLPAGAAAAAHNRSATSAPGRGLLAHACKHSSSVPCLDRDVALVISNQLWCVHTYLTHGQGAAEDARNRANALRPLLSLTRRLESSLAALGVKLPGSHEGHEGDSESSEGGLMPLPPPTGPVSGQLFIEGRLGGSILEPEADVDIRVEQASVGATRLSQVRGRGEQGLMLGCHAIAQVLGDAPCWETIQTLAS